MKFTNNLIPDWLLGAPVAIKKLISFHIVLWDHDGPMVNDGEPKINSIHRPLQKELGTAYSTIRELSLEHLDWLGKLSKVKNSKVSVWFTRSINMLAPLRALALAAEAGKEEAKLKNFIEILKGDPNEAAKIVEEAMLAHPITAETFDKMTKLCESVRFPTNKAGVKKSGLKVVNTALQAHRILNEASLHRQSAIVSDCLRNSMRARKKAGMVPGNIKVVISSDDEDPRTKGLTEKQKRELGKPKMGRKPGPLGVITAIRKLEGKRTIGANQGVLPGPLVVLHIMDGKNDWDATKTAQSALSYNGSEHYLGRSVKTIPLFVIPTGASKEKVAEILSAYAYRFPHAILCRDALQFAELVRDHRVSFTQTRYKMPGPQDKQPTHIVVASDRLIPVSNGTTVWHVHDSLKDLLPETAAPLESAA
jgi:hypothetical protein